jgi:hypothetical protein
MAKVKFKRNYAGVGELLHSKEMEGALMSYASTAAGRAGEGYKAKQMGTRVIVVADTDEAEQDNYDNNTLLKKVRK